MAQQWEKGDNRLLLSSDKVGKRLGLPDRIIISYLLWSQQDAGEGPDIGSCLEMSTA